jgi:hypothetical protein
MAVFFVSQQKTHQKWTLASVALTDAYTDFMPSHQLMAYRRRIERHGDNEPLFQTREGRRFASDGFIQVSTG